MRYEFDLFGRITDDQSKIFVHDEKDLSIYKAAINKKYTECYKIIVANFDKNKNGLDLTSRRDISLFHPEIENVNKLQLSLYYDDITQWIGRKGLKALKIKQEEIICYGLTESINGTTFFIKVHHCPSTIPLLEARYYYYNIILKEEVDRIKKSVNDHVHTLRSSMEIEHYIHMQQQALLTLSFRLIRKLNPESVQEIYKPAQEYSIKDILNLTYINLEDLQRFFETSFLEYINKDIQIPYRSTLLKIYRVYEKLDVVKNTFLNSSIDPALLQIMYNFFLQLDSVAVKGRISYKELIYINTFLTAFYDEIKFRNNNISESNFLEIAHEFNFNGLELFEYKIRKIKSEAAGFDDDDPQLINYYYRCLKNINQRQSKLNIAYKTDRPSLKDQVKGWLEEEISYLVKRQSLNRKPQQDNLFTHDDGVKLKAGVSVAQLSYAFRLFKEVGFIQQKNQRDIFRHIAANYSTAKVNEISQDSVSTRFYNHEEADIEAVRGLLIAMLNKTREEIM